MLLHRTFQHPGAVATVFRCLDAGGCAPGVACVCRVLGLARMQRGVLHQPQVCFSSLYSLRVWFRQWVIPTRGGRQDRQILSRGCGPSLA